MDSLSNINTSLETVQFSVDCINLNKNIEKNEIQKSKQNVLISTDNETRNLLKIRQTIIDSLELDNRKLREKITIICRSNEENQRQIEELKLQLIDCRNIKKYADFNKIAARKLIGIEIELNTLREKNTDLIQRNFCLTFEKNELYNLIKSLENKIQKSNCDIERLTAEMKQVEKKSSKPSLSRQTLSENPSATRTGFESEKANLIRQVEFYKNKLFLMESNLEKKDKEIENLKENLMKLTNKLEIDQLDFQTKYDEVNNYHKNKLKELYEIWKKDYTSLEYNKKITENDLLTLQAKYSKLENSLLESQKRNRSVDDIRTKYETLQIKYDTEKIKLVKQNHELKDAKSKDLLQLRDDLKKSEENKIHLEEKLSKIQSLLNLETKKNEHLRDKCRDYWTLLTTKDEQLKLAQHTVEKQIIERQKLLKDIDFYKTACTENGVVLAESTKSISKDLEENLNDKLENEFLEQLERNQSKLTILEHFHTLSSNNSTANLTDDGSTTSTSKTSTKKEYNMNVVSNIITENVKDFTIAKKSMKKRLKKSI